MRKISALILLACLAAPAQPQQTFQLQPICEGPVLRGLRGHVPKSGPITIYIPVGICEGRGPVTRNT